MDIDEIAAALVDASLGYHTAESALRHAEDYLTDETTCWCERCLALYGGDLRRSVEDALRCWAGVPDDRKAKVRRFVRVMNGRPWIEQVTASLRYPTSGPQGPFSGGA